jgi:hypothetical protein
MITCHGGYTAVRTSISVPWPLNLKHGKYFIHTGTYESVKNCLKFEITTYRTPTVARRFRLASPLFLFLHLLR